MPWDDPLAAKLKDVRSSEAFAQSVLFLQREFLASTLPVGSHTVNGRVYTMTEFRKFTVVLPEFATEYPVWPKPMSYKPRMEEAFYDAFREDVLGLREIVNDALNVRSERATETLAALAPEIG